MFVQLKIIIEKLNCLIFPLWDMKLLKYINVLQNICQTKTYVGKWRSSLPQKCGLLSVSKIPLCIHESTFLWVERKGGVHILLLLGYFLHRRTSIHGHLLIASICIPKIWSFLPFSKWFFYYSFFLNNCFLQNYKRPLMVKKDTVNALIKAKAASWFSWHLGNWWVAYWP